MTRHRSVVVAVIGAAVVGAMGPALIDALGIAGTFVALAVGVSLALSARRRRQQSGRPLFSLAFGAVMPVVLGLGAAFNRPSFALERTSSKTWLLIGLGTVSYLVGAQLAPTRSRAALNPSTDRVLLTRRQLQVVNWITCAALALAAVNLATGDVALLSRQVNTVRFSGSFGSLSKFWPFAFGALQATLVLRMIGRRRRGFGSGDIALTLATIGVFALSAGRAFLALVIGAVAIEIFERRRTSLLTVFAVLVGGAVIAGALGFARTSSEFGPEVANQSLRENGLPSGAAGSALQGLVTGPRVLSRAVQVVPQDTPFRFGGFFLSDFANFFRPSVDRGDRWVTITIMKRNVDTNGGQPPTLVGGLWLDFGWLGVAIGMASLAVVTQILYSLSRDRPSPIASGVFAFWSSYLLLALYSYVSLKPQIVAAFAVFGVCRLLAPPSRSAIKPVVVAA
jgi:hypothetical protein